MPFLLDTNILSELRKGARCDPNVSNWAAKRATEGWPKGCSAGGEAQIKIFF